MPAPAALRLCRVRTGEIADDMPFNLDPDGFLAEQHRFSWSADEPSDGALVPAAAAAQSPVFVLLGEPGVGKTTVLKALTEGLAEVGDAADDEPGLLWLDGADVTDSSIDRRLIRHLEQLPPRPGARADDRDAPRAQLTIVLDQLDESPLLLRGLAGHIREALKGRDTRGMRWLVACRAVDYQPLLTRQLQTGGRPAVVADLAPLRRADAVRLAGELGADGESLISAAISAGAGPLASIPLTLRLLCRLSRSGTLTGTAQNLFGHSVQLLLAEHRDTCRDLGVRSEQLLAVAARIAATVVLSGSRTIWIGRELADVTESEDVQVRAGTFTGGQEKTTAGWFPVTDTLVRQALATSVFSPRGDDHLAFAHSSIAAYLAAWHLHQRGIPTAQLKSLLLVASDDGTSSVPPSLRETAAWLITLQPAHAGWLTEADPRSLASYSNLVDNRNTRRALVTAMLRHAGELELSDLPWQLDRTRLSYDGLGSQLTQVLTDAQVAPQAWPDRARVILAIRLAHQADPDDTLIEALLSVAESGRWDIHERRLAVIALGALAPTVAAGRLRHILDSELADTARQKSADPDDELRGSILDVLWPQSLTLAEVLRYLGPKSNDRMHGSYARFLHDLPLLAADDDLPALLEWAERSRTRRPEAAATRQGTSTAAFPESERVSDVHPMAEETLYALLDRATSWDYGTRYINQVAAIVWPIIRDGNLVAVPGPLAALDENGQEHPKAQQARRALCIALCRIVPQPELNSPGVLGILDSWTRRPWSGSLRHNTATDGSQHSGRSALIDASDFAWLMNEATAALEDNDASTASLVAELASYVMDPDDRDAHEVAFTFEHTPFWAQLRGHFAPIELDSDIARHHRRRIERTRARDDAQSEDAVELRNTIHSDLTRAVTGDTTAFWQLLWNLQFDPRTGRGHTPSTVDDPHALPAAPLTEPQLSKHLPQLATAFVTGTHDHRDEWLGKQKCYKPAWAGYLALASLDRLGLTATLTAPTWANWVGALLWFAPGTAGDERWSRRRRLLAQASQHAFEDLNAALPTYILGEVATGSQPWDSNLEDPEFVARHRDVLYEIAEALGAALKAGVSTDGTNPTGAGRETATTSTRPTLLPLTLNESNEHAARHTLGPVLRSLLLRKHEPAIEMALAGIRDAPSAEPGPFATVCAAALLYTGAVDLATLLGLLQGNDELGVRLARHVSTSSHPINQRLDEADLAQLLNWLESLPCTAEELNHRAWVVGDIDGVRQWRAQTLRDLTRPQSPAALGHLHDLSRRFPDRLDYHAAVLTVRTAVQASLWRAPSAADIATLLTGDRRRLIRTRQELTELVTDTLDRIADDLPTHGELLWDRRTTPAAPDTTQGPKKRVDLWRPKLEASFSAYIAHELTIRLQGRGIAVNREVMVKPTDAYGAGDRTDILIEAFPSTAPPSDLGDGQAARTAVVIEAKGQWNPGLDDDLESQLAERYLPEAQTNHGIYLVAWFPMDQWNDTSDPKRRHAKNRDRDQTRARLEQRAGKLEQHQVKVRIVEVPRPFPSPGHPRPVISHGP